jgi:hypothetical protein
MSEHTQVGPYALGLLDPLEMSRFEEHLAECDECGTQLEWMLPVADLMADVEPGDLYGIDGPSAFSTPGGSVQQSMTMTEPTTRSAPQAQSPGPAEPYAPLRDLHAPQYPNDFPAEVDPRTGSMPMVDPRTGNIPRVDPRTGSMPAIDPRTGGIPTVDPRTGSMPAVDPRTGNISRVDPRTGSMPAIDPRTGSMPAAGPRSGSIPRVDPRTGSVPRVDPRTGDVARVDPAAGENRIVPLVRGGDSRRRNPSRPVGRRPEEMGPPNRQRTGLLIAAAAAILGAAVGAGAMVSGPWANNTGANTAAPELRGPRVTNLAATDAATKVHATVAMDSRQWGTLVSFSVADIDGPRKCQLVAITSDNKEEVLSSWLVPDRGYGAGTEPPKLTLMAGTALAEKDITAFQIKDVTNAGAAKTLVTVRS